MTRRDVKIGQFIVSRCNRDAYNALSGCFKDEIEKGKVYLLRGPHSSGKSMLLNSIANEVKQHHPKSNIYIETGESIVCRLIESYNANKGAPQLIAEECDLLIVEDVDFLAGKNATLQWLGEVLNNHIKKGTIVVISCNSRARGLECLENEIESIEHLFVKEADRELRHRLISQKLNEKQILLKPCAIRHLAGSKLSVSQLIGLIKTLVFVNEILDEPITMRQYKKIYAQFEKQVR